MDTIELRSLRLTLPAFFWLLVKLRMRRYGRLYALFTMIGVYALLSGAETCATRVHSDHLALLLNRHALPLGIPQGQ